MYWRFALSLDGSQCRPNCLSNLGVFVLLLSLSLFFDLIVDFLYTQVSKIILGWILLPRLFDCWLSLLFASRFVLLVFHKGSNSQQVTSITGKQNKLFKWASWVPKGIPRNISKTTTLSCGKWRCNQSKFNKRVQKLWRMGLDVSHSVTIKENRDDR